LLHYQIFRSGGNYEITIKKYQIKMSLNTITKNIIKRNMTRAELI